MLQSKQITLSSISAVAPILNQDNKDEIISSIKGRSARTVDMLLVGLNVKRPSRDRIRPIPCKQSADTATLFPELNADIDKKTKEEKRYEFNFAVSEETMEKYEEVKSLLSNRHPKGAAVENVLDELLEVYLEKHSPERREKRRRIRKAKKIHKLPPTSEVTKSTRYVPQEVKDFVWVRDGGRCAFVAPDGRRCNSRHNLQFEHIKPYAKGGDSSVGNIELLCFHHNQYRAECEYGKKHVKRFQE